ncbi:MAG TPA: flagellar basal body-associated FliL family protein [Calditrichia bacterium]|nr:flagellar basal body-associated FliL family protein [Calditrichota bacterium]HQU70651.1 flagellar basal body-associated FliL family protein [Calditrichia bacterium]HQV30393.1 flagellar basal body-associated FliL family protein [Calditrichia bacterium]
MADEKKPADAPQEKKKSNIMLYVGLFMAQIVIAGALVWFVLLPYFDATRAAERKPGTEQTDGSEDEEGDDGEEGDEPTTLGPTFTIESLTVNPKNSGGRRMLNFQVVMEMKNEEIAPMIQSNEPIIRSTLLRFFSGKSVNELANPAALDSLPIEVRDLVNETLPGKRPIKKVFFTRFIIQ